MLQKYVTSDQYTLTLQIFPNLYALCIINTVNCYSADQTEQKICQSNFVADCTSLIVFTNILNLLVSRLLLNCLFKAAVS